MACCTGHQETAIGLFTVFWQYQDVRAAHTASWPSRVQREGQVWQPHLQDPVPTGQVWTVCAECSICQVTDCVCGERGLILMSAKTVCGDRSLIVVLSKCM